MIIYSGNRGNQGGYMKQIDKEIAECNEAIQYVSNQYPQTLDKIRASIDKFNSKPASTYTYHNSMHEIRVYADELEHLMETERRNRFMLESLEQIKDEDYC